MVHLLLLPVNGAVFLKLFALPVENPKVCIAGFDPLFHKLFIKYRKFFAVSSCPKHEKRLYNTPE